MKALVVRAGSGTSPRAHTFINSIAVEDVELDPPGEGEVLVEITASGLCHSDLSVLTGDRPRQLPLVLGHEATGIVRERGRNVDRTKVGDRVVLSFVPACGRCEACHAGHPALCGPGGTANASGTLVSGGRRLHDASGATLAHHLGVSGFAPYAVVAEQSAVVVRSDLPAQQLALFGCAVLTGAGAVFNAAAVRPGSSVAVFGCGGVGLAAVLAARACGAAPIVAIDLDDRRLRYAARAGADITLIATSGGGSDELVSSIREQTGGGVDYALEAAGTTGALQDAYAATRDGGTVVAIGLANPSARVALGPAELVTSGRSLVGCYMGSSVPERDIPLFVRLCEHGRLPVDRLAGHTFALDEVDAAIDDLVSGAGGRQILIPTQ